MADGGILATPYTAVDFIFEWIGDRTRWHHFHGWAAYRGLEPLTLTTPQFCDLIHRYMLMVVEDTKPKGADPAMGTHAQINRMLIGEVGQTTRSRIDDRGIPMPSWWNERDSEGVTLEQAQAAAMGMRRR